MEWLTRAQQLREDGLSYNAIAKEVGQAKSKVYYHLTRDVSSPSTQDAPEPSTEVQVIRETIMKMAKKGATLEEIAYKLPSDVGQEEVAACIEELKTEHIAIVQTVDGKFTLQRHALTVTDEPYVRDWAGDTVMKFGIVSDSHMGSIYQQVQHLHAMYDLFVHEGITTVYHAGDIVEGSYPNRPGHNAEVFIISADQQVKNVVENYPRRDGITTHFISGNHDHTYLKAAGHDVGHAIAAQRDDLIYYGPNEAKFQLTPKFRMDMIHPGDGSSYALSYAIQKTIESLAVNDLPQFLVVGHHHKSIYLNTRGIHAIEAGTFQAQSSWMKGKRLAAHVGGWIITIHFDKEGRATRFTPSWIPFDDVIKRDYNASKYL